MVIVGSPIKPTRDGLGNVLAEHYAVVTVRDIVHGHFNEAQFKAVLTPNFIISDVHGKLIKRLHPFVSETAPVNVRGEDGWRHLRIFQ